MLPVTQPGNYESIKSMTHGLLGGLAVICCAYNSAAYYQRREPHLAQNMLLYGALALLEAYQLTKHAHRARIMP